MPHVASRNEQVGRLPLKLLIILRRDKAQLMRDTGDNKKKLIRELNTLRCHSL